MSDTFLFDSQNTGRMKYSKGDKETPELVWKTKLPSFPEYGPESNCIIDENGNLYFGCHNGNFYSLNNSGSVRWSFYTGGKIYSSPSFIEGGGIVVGSGSGYLYCFDVSGNLQWAYKVTNQKKSSNSAVVVNCTFEVIRSIYGRVRKRFINYQHADGFYTRSLNEKTISIWASPKVLNDSTVIISGAGVGLHAVNGLDGERKWEYNLGNPNYHIAGPVIDSNKNIYIPSKTRYLHCLDSKGDLNWIHDSESNYHAWAAPSIDEKNKRVFYSRSLDEKKAVLYAVDLDGNLVWSKQLNAAVRGSAAVSNLDYILIGDFSGKLHFISKIDGNIKKSISLTNARRGLWTTPSIDTNGNIFISVKETRYSGIVYCLDNEGNILWEYKTGKALSTPVLDKQGRLYFGNWNGEYICLQT